MAEIQDWLTDRIARELEIDSERITADESILSFGIDSMQVVTIVAGLEDWLGFRFRSNPLEEHPTIRGLAQFAASEERDARSAEG